MKYAHKIIVSTFILLVFTGCTRQTKQDVLDKSKVHLQFEVDKNYQQVYRDLSDEMIRCLAFKLLFSAPFKIDRELYNELGKGEILWFMDDALGHHVYLLAVVEKLDSQRTKVTADSKSRLDRKIITAIQTYVLDGKGMC